MERQMDRQTDGETNGLTNKWIYTIDGWMDGKTNG